jgi:hypothetical protein
LAVEVVLPVPFTPMTRMTLGFPSSGVICGTRFGQNLPHMLAGHLDDVRAVKLPLLRFEVGDDLNGQTRPEVAADERGFEVVPIDVGLGEALKQGFEETGHDQSSLGAGAGLEYLGSFGSQLLREAIEHAIHERAGFTGAEGFGYFDGFVEDDRPGHLRAVGELIDGHAQHIAIDAGEALEAEIEDASPGCAHRWWADWQARLG